MFCGQCVRLFISVYFMSIGPAAVTAARPGLEASASLVVDRAVHEAMWSLDYGLHDKCDNFGARKSRQKPYCECLGATVPSKQCDADEDGRFMGFLIEPEDGCSCLAAAGVSRERSVFVRASALKFCSAILDKTAEARGKLEELVATKANSYLDKYGRRVTRLRMNELKPEEVHFVKVANNLRDYVRKELGVTQKLCREVLTGSSREDQEWYSGATELAEHEDAKGFGHLDPLVTGSVESHRVLLQKVCKDECEGIVDETINNINKMVQWDVGKKTMPFEQSCADRVVRKVESEILGCCGRACGWNNRSCMAWPFFTKDQKVEWLDECCTEFNVLDGSSRERMCDSVLTPEQVKLISRFNTKAKEGTDVGGAYTGQDPPLLWTQKGISEFKLNVAVNSEVSSDFLEKHSKIRRKGLDEGWFKEDQLDEKGVRPSALIQRKGCSLTEMYSCSPPMKVSKMESCHAAGLWEHSKKPDDDPDTYCKSQTGTPVATPDDCILASFPEAGNIIRRFFEYKNQEILEKEETLSGAVPKHPIICHVESDRLPCEGDFAREALNIANIVNGRDAFDDYLYWIEEEKAKERREELKFKLKK